MEEKICELKFDKYLLDDNVKNFEKIVGNLI